MTIFTTFFLGNIGQKNVFYDILEPKNYFLRHKNKKTSQAKTLIGQWNGFTILQKEKMTS